MIASADVLDSRFFGYPCEELENRLEAHFEWAREMLCANRSVAANVESLVLGGGYGRGEGGVLQTGEGAALYNDLDYFLFCRNPESADLAVVVEEVERKGSQELGIDVEVHRMQLRELDLSPQSSMMFYDLIMGHFVVLGPDDYLTSRWSDFDGSAIEIEEATRLLWNRGSGLYLARRRIEETKEACFVNRNHQKFMLAAGDAWLTTEGGYHYSCRERLRRIEESNLEDQFPGMLERYRNAVEFKFAPSPPESSWEELAAENEELTLIRQDVFLHVEGKRLERRIESLREYGELKKLFPAFPRWKGLLYAGRDRLKRGGYLKPALDHPRGALFRVLACLNDPSSDESVAGFLPGLGPNPQPREVENEYLKWWHRYG